MMNSRCRLSPAGLAANPELAGRTAELLDAPGDGSVRVRFEGMEFETVLKAEYVEEVSGGPLLGNVPASSPLTPPA